MELKLGGTIEGRAPESAPDLLLDPLLDGRSPLRIHETDVGCTDLDVGCTDLDVVCTGVRAVTIGSLISNGCDHLSSVVGERPGNGPDTIDIETWVWATRNDRRKGESPGEVDPVFEDAIEVSLRMVKSEHDSAEELRPVPTTSGSSG